jgi:hypothetical protein
VWETFVLNQLTRAKIAKGSSAQIFFWRDAHGVEVDFIIEHQGALRLIEAKWTETITDERTINSLLKVARLLGDRAAKEHWVVCRAAYSHHLSTHAEIALLNGYEIDDWLPTLSASD